MEFPGFTDKDFDVFHVPGLEARMEHIQTDIRPKFEKLGELLTPTLSVFTGDEMFPHIAKHARRTVNPPNDTWIAFSNNRRGYKKHPHFQIGLWKSHLFVWFAMIYESPYKGEYALNALDNIDTILKEIPDSFVWSTDHTQPEATKQKNLNKDDFRKMLTRLKDIKKAELLCGIHIQRDNEILQDGDKLVQIFEETFKTLMPLYHMARVTS